MLMNAPYQWEQIANERFLTPLNVNIQLTVFEKACKAFDSLLSIVPHVGVFKPEQALVSMPRLTHPGYPAELRYRTKEDAIQGMYPFLINAMDLRWKGDLCVRTNRKVEMRKAQKFVDKAVRTIASCDVTMISNGVRLFTPLMEELKMTALRTPYWCGKGRYHGIPNQLKSQLWPHAQVLDITAQDSSACRPIYQELYAWKCRKITEIDEHAESGQTRKNLYEKIFWYMEQILTSPLVDSKGRVYLRDHGNPSGQYCTTSDNTLDMMFSIIYCLIWNGRDPLSDDYRWKVLGDDTIFTARLISLLVSLNWITPMSELGKKVKVGAICATEDAEFLGDRLVYRKELGMWMPIPYDMDKMKCAWRDHCRQESPLMNYIRTYNFYVQCFWDEEFRGWCEEALRALEPDPAKPFDMDRVKLDDVLRYEDQTIRGDVIKSLPTSPFEIVQLYTGWQTPTPQLEQFYALQELFSHVTETGGAPAMA
jgi:hypothetical protein